MTWMVMWCQNRIILPSRDGGPGIMMEQRLLVMEDHSRWRWGGNDYVSSQTSSTNVNSCLQPSSAPLTVSVFNSVYPENFDINTTIKGFSIHLLLLQNCNISIFVVILSTITWSPVNLIHSFFSQALTCKWKDSSNQNSIFILGCTAWSGCE